MKKLLSADFDAYIAANLAEAQNYIRRQLFRIILTDLRLGGDASGLDIVQLAIAKNINCVGMTAFGDVETAVAAMKNGAFDFVTKPLNLQKLKITLKQAIANDHNRPIKNTHFLPFPEENSAIFAENSPFKRTLDDAIKVADNSASILPFGETGTGKEVLAQAIHRSSR
ncbi:MAG: response regulator, partial [Puniceicoccales bacterium]|nr:response regulator [Puniceicoccales bacterium]